MTYQVVTVTLNPAIDRTYKVNELINGALNRADNVRWDAGGKGINVARALKNLGVDVLATGFIAGSQGRVLLDRLNEEGIPNDFLEVSGETRVNIKISDSKNGTTTEVNGPGFCVGEEDIHKFLSKLDNLSDGAEYLVLSGSLPNGCKPDLYADIIERYRGKNLKIILDADNEALIRGASAKPFAIKPNQHEVCKLANNNLNNESDFLKEAQRLQQTGIGLVCVTLGKDGLILISETASYKATSFYVVPASTTGAGDASLAAMVYGLISKAPISDIAAMMACAGALSVSKPGTNCCTLSELNQNLNRVEMTRIG